MAELNYDQIISELKKKIFRPVYLLMGEEPYYIDLISEYMIENILTEDEKAFNQSIFYGKDADVKLIATHAKRFPMMANYQLMVIKEAKDLKKIEELAYYLENPLKSTILVICHKYDKYDKRKKVYQLCDKHGAIYESKKLYENQVHDWIIGYLHSKGFTIDPIAITLLIDFIGTDLVKMANELDKLTILLPVGTKISADKISLNIGISKEYNIFEFIKALGYKNSMKAIQIADYIGRHPKENRIDSVMGRLYDFFTKLIIFHQLEVKTKDRAVPALGINPYFYEDYRKGSSNYSVDKLITIISILREYDAKAKGIGSVSASYEELMVEMTCKILI